MLTGAGLSQICISERTLVELKSQESCSEALAGLGVGVIQGEGATACTGAMKKAHDEADQGLPIRQNPWKQRPDQLWGWGEREARLLSISSGVLGSSSEQVLLCVRLSNGSLLLDSLGHHARHEHL